MHIWRDDLEERAHRLAQTYLLYLLPFLLFQETESLLRMSIVFFLFMFGIILNLSIGKVVSIQLQSLVL